MNLNGAGPMQGKLNQMYNRNQFKLCNYNYYFLSGYKTNNMYPINKNK